MHYKNGREAKIGDTVLAKNWNGQPYTGLVTSITPGSTSCNAVVIPLPVVNGQNVTLGDCLHTEDAIKAD
jgi:hypothetical protein